MIYIIKTILYVLLQLLTLILYFRTYPLTYKEAMKETVLNIGEWKRADWFYKVK